MDNYINLPCKLNVSGMQPKIVLNISDGSENDSALEMLDKINKACGLNTQEHTNHITLTSPVLLNNNDLKKLNIKFVVVYGIPPNNIGRFWDNYRYRWINDQNIDFCFADDLNSISQDKKKKEALWSNLKKIKATVQEL